MQLLIPAAVHATIIVVHVVPTVVRGVVLLTLIIARVPIIVVHVIVAVLVLTVAVRVPIAVVKALPAVAAVLHRVPNVRKAVLPMYGVLPEAVPAAAVLLQQEAVVPVVPAVLQAIVAKQKTSELFVYLPNNSFLCTAFAQSLSGPTREAWYVAL